jgi:hypothetical protein
MDNSGIIETTEGFYKKEGDNWMYAPNFVFSNNYELKKELKDTYNYPVDGWNWYDNQPENFLIKNDDNTLLETE